MKALNSKFRCFLFLIMLCLVTFKPLMVNSLEKGEIKNSVVSVGSLTNPGDVMVTKTITNTNTLGEYKVIFEAQGRNVQKIISIPVYATIVFDTSGSMICGIDNSGNWTYSNVVKNNEHYIAADGTKIVCKDWFNGNSVTGLTKDKWESAIAGAKEFSKDILQISNSKINLVTFSSNVKTIKDWTDTDLIDKDFGYPNGSTNLASAIKEATKNLKDKDIPSNANKIIIIISDGDPDDVNDAIKEASLSKSEGNLIYTIGYNTTQTAASTLAKISGSNIVGDTTTYNYVSETNNLNEVFTAIGQSIKTNYAGTNATIYDVIGDGFTYVPNTTSSENVIVNGKNIVFKFGDITETKTSFSFNIKINEKSLTGWYPTNNISNSKVKINYLNPEAITTEKVFSKTSEIYWIEPTYNYTINYYKEDETTDFKTETIKETLNSIIDYEKLKDKILSNTPIGYKYKELNPTSITITEEGNHLINITYKKIDNLSYQVKYHYEGLDDYIDNNYVESNVLYNTKTSYLDKVKEGYKLDYVTGNNLEVINNSNIVDVYYIKEDYYYIINYYKDGISAKNYLNTIKEKTKYLDNITVDITKYLPEHYHFIGEIPKIIISNNSLNNIVNIVYQKIDYKYVVKYYYDNIYDNQSDENGTACFGESINKYVDKARTGYKTDNVNFKPLVISDNQDNNILKVYYTKVEVPITGISKNYDYFTYIITLSGTIVMLLFRKKILIK